MNASQQNSQPTAGGGQVTERLLSLALEIADRRARIQKRMKTALLDNDTDTALRFARVLCGLEQDDDAADFTEPLPLGQPPMVPQIGGAI